MEYHVATCKPDTEPPNPYIHALIEVKSQSLGDSIPPRVFTFLGQKPHNYPTIPLETQAPDPSPRAPALPQFDIPGWFVSSLPFLGFAPSSNPFKCQFLQCLDYNADVLPIERDERRNYVLNPSLRDDWDSLERNMRAFLTACRHVNPLGLTPGFRFWPYPRQYGYCLAWKTANLARWAAWRSRQAFIPLIAAISFFLRMLYHLEKKWVALLEIDRTVALPDPNPFWSARQNEYLRLRRGPVPSKFEWQERLQRETSISSEWLSYFYQIMELPMAGVFMNVNNRSCIPLIPVFLEANMPLVLYWGTLGTWYESNIPKALTSLFSAPTVSNVKSLQSKIAPYIFPSVVPDVIPVANSLRLRMPRLIGGAQPHPNETIHAFIKRREDDRMNSITSETPGDRQSRLQREENARKDRPPGRRGARVFYWDLVEGVRVRGAAGRRNYETLWERYGPS